MSDSAEKDGLYEHGITVNVGGKGPHPIVTLWCMDCIETLADLGQNVSLTDVQRIADEHRAKPTLQERLPSTPPGMI